ncbi:HEPN domain-containing protein [Roseococcus microcysteis]|uniref:HEPN domain-containing protein n=1 Tax=Roseococcus microcysteis TaxID=2771361 RepID=UPI00168ABB71|nr:HEPN domain-containing protein [Roseococcus microcysteis]
MSDALAAFKETMSRLRAMHGVYLSIRSSTTSALDLSDFLRSEIVLAVSALDFFIHRIVLEGMLEIFDGNRPNTSGYSKFGMPILSVRNKTDEEIRSSFSIEVQQSHSFLSFQRPDKIADAVRKFSSIELWNSVGVYLGKSPKDVKMSLELLVDRRNKIAHEADIDPTFGASRWTISEEDVTRSIDLVEEICVAIYQVTR